MARMAMATRQVSTATKPTTSRYMSCLLVLIVTAAIVNTPALADHSSPPSTLVLYAYRKLAPPNASTVVVGSPSGNLSAIEFGTTVVIGDVLRETEDPDAPAIGVITGVIIYGIDLSPNTSFLTATYFLNTTSYAGSISTQNDAISGGTGDFIFATGYLDVTILYQDPTVLVSKIVLHIKYD